MSTEACDPQTQCCAACGQKRLPRYKTDKSWAKHQEFCKGPTAPKTENKADTNDKVASSSERSLISRAERPPKVEAPAASRASVSIDDLPRLVEDLAQQLEGIEFVAVQLGATLGEHGLSEENASKLARGDGAGVRPSSADASQQAVAKEQVLERLRQEFLKRFPATELVSQDPDLKLLFDMSLWQFSTPIPTAIFLYGRYRKLERGIPQTRWPCAACRGDRNGRYGKRKLGSEPGSGKADVPAAPAGEGIAVCESCKGSGLQYAHSVQDLIGCSIVHAFAAEDGIFHGMGREDIDVRCLGQGRPFVLELKAPRRRGPSKQLDVLTAEVNKSCGGKVELGGALRLSSRTEPARIKAAASDKTYTIRFRVEGGFDRSQDEALIFALAGRALDQRTPSRVEHRRADLVRGRTILCLGPLEVDGEEVELTIKAESGTYIKEFVHGDAGRTVPSVSEVLGRKCEVVWLDVKEIHGE